MNFIKNVISFAMLMIPTFVAAQQTFKFQVVNADTGEPMPKKWLTILKNHDEYVDFTPTDSNGVCTFKVRNFDSGTSFEVEISNHGNNKVQPGLFDITAVTSGMPVIKVKPASDSLPFGCGEIMYLPYHATEPNSISDLPATIRQKVERCLVSRVGRSFYKKIALNGGQIVNLNRLYALNTFAKANNFVPPAYSLCFMVWDSVSHKSLYTFQLKLDSNGVLKEPVPLPDISHHPERATILSLEEVKATATAEGFDKAWTEAKTIYHNESQVVAWAFTQTERGEGRKRRDILYINAHNGKIINKVTSYVSVYY